MTNIIDIISALPVATTFIIVLLIFFGFVFYKANKDPQSPVDWTDLIMGTDKRVDPYKLGFCVGMIVSTWIVVVLAGNDKLTYDIFGIYLAFLLGGAGWTSFVNRGKQQ